MSARPSRPRRPARSRDVPGLAARRAALTGLLAVTAGRSLDDALDPVQSDAFAALEPRDRALARSLARTALRRGGQIEAVLKRCLSKGLPKGETGQRVGAILRLGTAQLLFTDAADHAAVDLCVRLALEDENARHFRPLINGVLRRIGREGDALLGGVPETANIPDWLHNRWTRAWGEDAVAAMAAQLTTEPPLDLTIKTGGDASVGAWAERLDAHALATGTVRRAPGGALSALPGFDDGAWWVQDAAAAVPATLLGSVDGLRIADLCAAPGGKTAQLASAGAHVTAVDRSDARLERLRENMTRLGLGVDIVTADALTWRPDAPLDAVLLDAPCSATGTVRRHPDVKYLKRDADIASLTTLQDRLLRHALSLLRPGGLLVYCTCSLEREEGEVRIASLLRTEADVRREPVSAAEVGGIADWITPDGDVRILPHVLPGPAPELSGSDGFFAARLRKL